MRFTYRCGFALAILCSWAAGPVVANAADTLSYGPRADWVQPQSVPAPQSAQAGAPLQLLLNDTQVNLAPKVSEVYSRSVLLIQTPEGLAGAGTVTLSWRPETDELTVHKLSIERDGNETDVLASGQSFTILHREDLLEYAVLSGRLTALLQPEGLRVGDRLQLEYTIKRTDPLLGGVPEQLLGVGQAAPVGRTYLRARWPASYPMKWQATKFLDGVQSSRVGGMNEVSTLREYEEPLQQPAGAPIRFAAVRLLQLTGHRSWSDISKLLYPLFERASRLSKTSPLQAEVSRIRQATSDPATRVEAALRLVQDQIRYVYLGMNDGPLVPADVDTTWTRRYGDCKAKTAMLLAILRELAVEAEPVAVSVALADALPDRLPMVRALDHVLVRATLEGKTYWLDGTRTGDRSLDELPTPSFAWGLPLRPAGSELKKIEVAALSEPLSETTIVIDASAGPRAAATFRAESVLRADAATVVQRALSGLTGKQRETALRNFWTRQRYWSNNWRDVALRAVTADFDNASGRVHLVMEGTGSMIWQGQQHLLAPLNLGEIVDLKREPGPNSDAPYMSPFPMYERVAIRIQLPGNIDYGVYGRPHLHRTIGGVQYDRSAYIDNGELVGVASARSLQPEFPASEAPQAQRVLREMWDGPVYATLLSAPTAAASSTEIETKPLNSCVQSVPQRDARARGSAKNVVAPALKLLAITPEHGTPVSRDSVLSADLEYAVSTFVPERIQVIAQFDTQDGNQTSGGSYNRSAVLRTDTGKLHFCFPMRHVWGEPGIKRPFSVRFYLTRLYDGGTSSVIAKSNVVTFPAAEEGVGGKAASNGPAL